MIPKRNRSARRADKYWQSVFLQQMLMPQRGLTNKLDLAKPNLGNSVNEKQETTNAIRSKYRSQREQRS
jgi:hypothetical protein